MIDLQATEQRSGRIRAMLFLAVTQLLALLAAPDSRNLPPCRPSGYKY